MFSWTLVTWGGRVSTPHPKGFLSLARRCSPHWRSKPQCLLLLLQHKRPDVRSWWSQSAGREREGRLETQWRHARSSVGSARLLHFPSVAGFPFNFSCQLKSTSNGPRRLSLKLHQEYASGLPWWCSG